jgi:glycogen debranching enzyme
MTSLVDEARACAEDILLGNGGPIGILAARRSYQQVWARDSMVCGLGLMVAEQASAADLHRRSLATLAHYQSPRGKIPHNVGFAGVADPALVAEGGALPGAPGKAIVDTAHAGCIDSNLWFILGHYVRHTVARDREALRVAWPSLQSAHTWLAYQDSNECGLLEAHEAKDWADLFANRYNSLVPNALWYAAHRALSLLARELGESEAADRFAAAATDIRLKLNMLLWVGPEVKRDYAWVAEHRAEWLYPMHRIDAELVQRPYYLPYVAFRDFADRFDAVGNVFAVLFGVADPAQSERIFDFIRATGLAEPWPIRVLYPVVHPGDKDWREYYRLRNLNMPDQYHNGGAWPFVGGFYVAALVRAGRIAAARDALERLAQMNRQSRDGEHTWEFNEWFHGRSNQPAGFPLQSWSAAMFVYAHECVRRERVPFFDPGDGW